MLRHIQEMAELGIIEVPEKLVIWNFTREYQFETPHFNIGKKTTQVLAKIEIPPSPPEAIDDFEILWHHKKFIVTNKLKKKILEWFQSRNTRGFNNWEMAINSWETSMEVHQKLM